MTGVHLMSSKYDKHRLLKGEIEFSNGEKTIEIALTDEQSRKLMLSLAVFLSESANEIANSIRDAFCLPNPQDQKEDDK